MKRLRALMPIASLAVLGGCGSAASSHPASSPAEAQRSPATIADAEADLARAEAQLPTAPGFGAVAGQPTTGARAQEQAPPKDAKPDAAAPPPQAAPAKPAARMEPKTEDAKKQSDKEASEVDAPTPCQTACRAFASMQRAADSVCRLAGDGDDRCLGAKKRVENAKARVAHCGCG